MSMEVEVAQAKSVLHKVESRRNDLKKNIEEVSEEIGSMSSAQETIEETIEREKATVSVGRALVTCACPCHNPIPCNCD